MGKAAGGEQNRIGKASQSGIESQSEVMNVTQFCAIWRYFQHR